MSSFEITHHGAKDAFSGSLNDSWLSCRRRQNNGETFMTNSKSHGRATGEGIPGIIQNRAAYQRWVVTIHALSHYLETTFSLANMKVSKGAKIRNRYNQVPTRIPMGK